MGSRSWTRVFVTLALLLGCTLIQAQGQQEDGEAARQLLHRAVDYYRAQGDAAFAAFSRQGEFIDGELYVFVIDIHGTMLASGGASAVLIGRDVTPALEPELRQAFSKSLQGPENQEASAEYRWLNARDGRVERKQVFYQRVGDRIIAVGHYLPRATPQQAQALLEKAVEALNGDAAGTLKDINGLLPRFREDDLYVFVIDRASRRYVAHGANLRLLGVDFGLVKDPEGNPVGAPILALAAHSDKGGYGYRWRNPVTSKVEDKYALFRTTGKYLVAVGYYQNPR